MVVVHNIIFNIIEPTNLGMIYLKHSTQDIKGATIHDFDQRELKIVLGLEYVGIVYRETSCLVYYDKNFEKYIMHTVSRRPQENLSPHVF